MPRPPLPCSRAHCPRTPRPSRQYTSSRPSTRCITAIRVRPRQCTALRLHTRITTTRTRLENRPCSPRIILAIRAPPSPTTLSPQLRLNRDTVWEAAATKRSRSFTTPPPPTPITPTPALESSGRAMRPSSHRLQAATWPPHTPNSLLNSRMSTKPLLAPPAPTTFGLCTQHIKTFSSRKMKWCRWEETNCLSGSTGPSLSPLFE